MWPNLRCTLIFPRGTEVTEKNDNKNSRRPGRVKNHGPPKYSGYLRTGSRCSILISLNNFHGGDIERHVISKIRLIILLKLLSNIFVNLRQNILNLRQKILVQIGQNLLGNVHDPSRLLVLMFRVPAVFLFSQFMSYLKILKPFLLTDLEV
jgi:hypothetical protein